MTGSPSTVFVYGTLVEPDRADAVLDDWRFAGEATLEGAHRVAGRYPTLAPGGTVPGRLLVTTELARLDRYERVDDGLYVRVAVPLDGGGHAWCYVGDPGRLDAPAAWPGSGDLASRVSAGLAARDARVRRVGGGHRRGGAESDAGDGGRDDGADGDGRPPANP